MREMKDSGVEWIGKIPKDWKTIKIKNLADVSIDNSFVDGDWIESPYITNEGIRYLTTGNIGDGFYKEQGSGFVSRATFKDLNCKLAFPGDLVIARLNSPYGRSCILPNVFSEYVLAVDIVILRPQGDKKYISYVTQCTGYQNMVEDGAKGTTMKRISRTNLGNILLPFPAKSVQEKIVFYLDSKCSQIDTIIEKQQTVIEKLREYKLSLITEAVTKGLNPDVPMKDSGVEWIGEIPEHWDVPKIKYIASIYSGATPDRNKLEYWNGEINWFKTGELQNNEIYYSEENITQKALNETSVKMFYEDTILMAMYGQGKTRGMTALLKTQGTTNQACAGIIINNKKMSVKYMWEFLKGAYNAIRQEAVGSGQPNLSVKLIADFYVTMPPMEEQRQIADFLDRKCSAIDATITKKQALIEKLTAYKKSLIYEVVTGKKEV